MNESLDNFVREVFAKAFSRYLGAMPIKARRVSVCRRSSTAGFSCAFVPQKAKAKWGENSARKGVQAKKIARS
ncbi:MAG: hypothetical protein AB1426_09705 [Bacillota bacterium]